MCGIPIDPIDLIAYIGMFGIGMVSGFLIDSVRGRS